MADLMIKLSPSLAKAGTEEGSPLARLIRAYGARLGSPSGVLEGADQYYRVEGVEIEKAELLRRELERLEGVEAAFIKPTDAMP